ncbi:hypothetical protein PENSPDRAFT_677713 [Peniophora sp. CONT]|nr:hypothetical protein PENSPDRAFT_677713 [Peniophora sp. CONT]
MSPTTKPKKNIKVHVARHNSQRIGPALTAKVEELAKVQRLRTDLRQPTNEPSSTIAQAIENASDWNSMLLTARAERGPQWDIGTQQFLVEVNSSLYFDPTPVRTHLKDERPPPTPSASHPPPSSRNPQPRGDLPGGMPPYMQNGSISIGGMNPNTPQRGGGMMGGGSMGPPMVAGSPYGSVPPNQFYGDRGQGAPMMTRGMSMESMSGRRM